MINDIFYGKVPGVKEPGMKKSFSETQSELNGKLNFSLPQMDKRLLSSGSGGFSEIMSYNKVANLPKQKAENPVKKIIAMTGTRQVKKPMIMSKPNFSTNKLKQFVGARGKRGHKNINQFMQIKAPNIQQKLYGDADRDGVRNILDCEPLNPNRQGWVHKLGSFVSGKGWTQSPEQDAKDAERKRAKREKAYGEYLAEETRGKLLSVQKEKEMRELGVTRAQREMARGDLLAQEKLLQEKKIPLEIKLQEGKLGLAESKLRLAEKERELAEARGEYQPGIPGMIQGIRDIGAFGHRGVMTAFQTGDQLGGGVPYGQRILEATGSRRDPITSLDKQINLARILGNRERYEYLSAQKQQLEMQMMPPPMPMQMQPEPLGMPQQPIPTQQPGGGGRVIVKDNVSYIEQPDGKWLNTKTGKIVKYPRGKYEGIKQRQLQTIAYAQPQVQQPIPLEPPQPRQQLMY